MRTLLLGLILLLPGFLSAQNDHAARIERAIEYLELPKATELALQEPDTKLRLYYQARIMFIRYLVSEEPGLLDHFLSLTKSSIHALDRLPDRDPQKNVLMAEMFFLRGAIKALNQRLLSSAVDLKSACNLIDRNYARFPDNPDQLKLLGIYHVAMSAIPRKLQWLGKVLCFKGNLSLGLDMLERAARESDLLPNEAQILLFYFEKNLLDRPKDANVRISRLHAAARNSIVYNYLLLSSFLELRENDRALDLCQEWEKRREQAAISGSPLPIWHYSCGKAWFFRLDYERAIAAFDQFLTDYQGSTLYADALYRKGMSLILSDRYTEAQYVFHELTRTEASGFDVDEYAGKMAAAYLLHEPSATDRELYAARNLFDGGYYAASLEKLSAVSAGNIDLGENQRTELYYRRGRNYHALDSVEMARNDYLKCIATEPGKSLWMKVYAHYYLGRIAEMQGNPEAARTWFKTALEFEDYPYQAGLEQRCKAALQQLKAAKKAPRNG
ncbi:MAG: tetratricopeptide repeat protein [Bacteroidota bacterium]